MGLSSGMRGYEPHPRSWLIRTLTIEDGSKERLDCYDDVVPPDPKPKPPAVKVVADCKFLKEEDERLGCFNRFLVTPARPVATKKGAPKVQPSK